MVIQFTHWCLHLRGLLFTNENELRDTCHKDVRRELVVAHFTGSCMGLYY